VTVTVPALLHSETVVVPPGKLTVEVTTLVTVTTAGAEEPAGDP